MISKKIQDAFNAQFNAETYSAYLYWSMSAALENMGLGGFAHWMRVQAKEELGHAQRFYDHIIARGGQVRFAAIACPPSQWQDVMAMMADTLAHEKKVTSSIHDLMDLALTEKDHAAVVFLQWFVNEQVEEEANVQQIIQRLEMAGQSKGAILMLDHQMASRKADS
ncbi:MAG: ferritin [Sedimentisphaerales bacterium]|nr:ferritin [Sedimentisphaerales bacterium]